MPFVYAFQSGSTNRFKIGRTSLDPQIRRKDLSTGNPDALTEVARIETEFDVLCETYLKRTLRSRRCTEGDATEMFELAPEEVKSAFAEAREFLQEYVPRQEASDLAAAEQSDGTLMPAGPRELELFKQILELREQEDRLRFKRELAERELKATIGSSDGIQGVATWRTVTQQRFDQKAFRVAQPTMWEAFVHVSMHRAFRLWKG